MTSQHPGEGRVDGWDELRREIEALPDVNPTPTLHAGAHTDWPMVKRADVLRLLAAARGEPEIDVERLRRIEAAASKVVSWHDRGGVITLWPTASGLAELRDALRGQP